MLLVAHALSFATALSARLVDDDVAVIFTPLLIFIQCFGRIEKCDGNTAWERSGLPACREEIAAEQEVLRIREHELEEQDRAVRVGSATGHGRAFEACHAGRDDQPSDRRPTFS